MRLTKILILVHSDSGWGYFLGEHHDHDSK